MARQILAVVVCSLVLAMAVQAHPGEHATAVGSKHRT
jgi:hypothetical protein